MSFKLNVDASMQALLHAQVAVIKARNNYEEQRKATVEAVQDAAAEKGYGKGAMVNHLQSDCDNGTMNGMVMVNSRVVNCFPSQDGLSIRLRIIVGRANGKGLSDTYANIDIDDVTLVNPSITSFER
jgi:hypothetical protein